MTGYDYEEFKDMLNQRQAQGYKLIDLEVTVSNPRTYSGVFEKAYDLNGFGENTN